MKIDNSNFNFLRNDKITQEIEKIGLLNISTKIYELLDLSKKLNYDKITVKIILDKLEDKKIQNKIIKKISNYNKIPKKIIDYYKNIELSYKSEEFNKIKKEISENNIKQFIIDYLRIRYNELSIFDYDINYIFFEGWHNNCLNEEGPLDYIIDRIKNFNKNNFLCIIS
jgi:hypothetical protein